MEEEKEETMESEPQREEEGLEPEPAAPTDSTGPPVTDHQMVPPGGTCAFCGWIWGDPVKGVAPHIVWFGSLRSEPLPTVAAPQAAAAKEPDPNACMAVTQNQTCPKCGWNYNVEQARQQPRPHPFVA